MNDPSFQPRKLSTLIGLWAGGLAVIGLIVFAVYSRVEGQSKPTDTSRDEAVPQIQLPDTARQWFNTQLGTKFRMPAYAQAAVTNLVPGMVEYQFRLPVESAEATLTLQEWELQHNLDELLMRFQSDVAFHNKVSTGREEEDFQGEMKFGRMTELYGKVAVPLIFFVTDTSNVFIQGQLMFDNDPNLPRLRPMLDRTKKDVWHMLETLKWE